MKSFFKRVRGAVGIGLTWAVPWSFAGTLVTLGFRVLTGSRPDAPFPIMFGVFGFVAGIIFSAVLRLAERHRRFDQMSLRRFAAWGALGGLLLATAFITTISLTGDPSFIWNLVMVGPLFAVAAAASATGTLALARRAHDPLLPPASDDMDSQTATHGLHRVRSDH